MAKKVLQISKYYYPFIGGTEQVARDIARALKKIPDIQQKIICFNEDAKDETFACSKRETKTDFVDGVEVIRCSYSVKFASQSISSSIPGKLKEIMNRFRPDIVILHYPNPYVTHFLLRYKKYPFKLVVYWHLDITKQKILGKLFYYQNRSLIKRADKIIGATPKHVEESAYTRYFKDKKEILPYAIDEERLQITEEEKQRAKQIRADYKGKFLCFFIGRHVPYKGLDYLLEASRHVSDEVRFIIAGKGELTEELMKKSKGNPKVIFIGKISDSEWRSYLWACDVFCFPSITRNEGFGLALAEGMYYGKPAVTFTIPGSGVNYVNLNNVTGIECPNGDSRAYADAIMKLHDEEELRMKYGRQARERILNQFTFSAFEKNICHLVESL